MNIYLAGKGVGKVRQETKALGFIYEGLDGEGHHQYRWPFCPEKDSDMPLVPSPGGGPMVRMKRTVGIASSPYDTNWYKNVERERQELMDRFPDPNAKNKKKKKTESQPQPEPELQPLTVGRHVSGSDDGVNYHIATGTKLCDDCIDHVMKKHTSAVRALAWTNGVMDKFPNIFQRVTKPQTPAPTSTPTPEPTPTAPKPQEETETKGRQPGLVPMGEPGYNPDDPRHGNTTSYKCKCGPCREFVKNYTNERNRNKGKCGSESGFRRHNRLGEQPCRKCRIGHSEFEKQTVGMASKEKQEYSDIVLYTKPKTSSWLKRYNNL